LSFSVHGKYAYILLVIGTVLWSLIVLYLALLSTGLAGIGVWKGMYRQVRSGPGRIRYLLRLAAAVAIAVAAWSLLDVGLKALPVNSYQLLIESFGGTFDYVLRTELLSLPGLFISFAAGSLIYPVATCRSVREFAKASTLPLAGIILAVASYAFLLMAVERLDLDTYIDDIPGISTDIESRVLITLDDPPITVPFCNYFNDCISGSFCRNLSSTSRNAKAIEGYLERTEYSTALRGPALSFLALERMNELDTLGAMKYYRLGYEITRDRMDLLFLLQRMDNGPATEPYRKELYDFASGPFPGVEGNYQLMAGRSFARFGDLERAREFYEAGMKDRPAWADADTTAKYKSLESPPFYACSVKGSISADGRLGDNINIGIIDSRFIIGAKSRAGGDMGGSFSPYFDFGGLIHGQKTAPDGSFEFEGLPEGEYVLLLSLPEVYGRTFTVLNSPGVISLSEDASDEDVGEVRLAAQ